MQQTGCDPGRACFLVSPTTEHSRTVCEFAYGEQKDGEDCTYTRDCFLKYTCQSGSCRRTCDTAACCRQGETFVPLGSEYGYCI
jgi:hypothetical protein